MFTLLPHDWLGPLTMIELFLQIIKHNIFQSEYEYEYDESMVIIKRNLKKDSFFVMFLSFISNKLKTT